MKCFRGDWLEEDSGRSLLDDVIVKGVKLKKGTYKVKVKVSATGNGNYTPSSVKTVTFKIKVK